MSNQTSSGLNAPISSCQTDTNINNKNHTTKNEKNSEKLPPKITNKDKEDNDEKGVCGEDIQNTDLIQKQGISSQRIKLMSSV